MHRENNFDAIRLIAAGTVIYGHAFPLAQQGSPSFLGNSVEAIAVKVFFVISGYLITASWLSDPVPHRYLAKRILRIFPALVVVVILGALVLGPLVTQLPLAEYFHGSISNMFSPWGYIFFNSVLYPIYSLPGVFLHNRYPGAVNGSLWSLPVEFFMYLLMPLVCIFASPKRLRWVVGTAMIALCAWSLYAVRIAPPAVPRVIYGTSLSSALDVCPYFFIGACYRVYRLEKWLDPLAALTLVGLALLIEPHGPVVSELTLYILLPYFVLTLATHPHPLLCNAGRYGDFSYGLYLYGFPVQQTIYHLTNNRLTPVENGLIALPIALGLAILSWHLIEKHALNLKPHAVPARLSAKMQEQPA